FNDFAEANDVTRRGRELIQRAVGLLEGLDAQVIEVDTDGIYFVPPPAVRSESDADALVEKLASVLPEGIKLEIDGRYPSMLSYKMKNYVLLDETGEMTIRGSGLKSRGLERFQRRFMEEMFALLMADRGGEFAALYHRWLGKLERHEIGIDDLMKTETLQDSLESYRAKMSGNRRNVSAAYELALKSARRYQSGDQISYYVIGRSPRVRVAEAARLAADYDAKNPDENVAYYQSKLLELYEKFRIFADRPGLFPAIALESAEQQTGSLFDLPKPD
ncbi:MAG TPA: DNA polymerase domain-containing protein, partial [Candidatus Binataceae bacterium]|nr:DNA polymerase domain-containing protein [Candidatus Binataceae bacterium]